MNKKQKSIIKKLKFKKTNVIKQNSNNAIKIKNINR